MKNDVSITKFYNQKDKTFKGNFDCLIKLGEVVFSIRNCSYFDNGEKQWVMMPDKKKRSQNDPNKWEHDFCFVEFLSPIGFVQDNIVEEVKKYKIKIEEECPSL